VNLPEGLISLLRQPNSCFRDQVRVIVSIAAGKIRGMG
jgi:hypothetical protein